MEKLNGNVWSTRLLVPDNPGVRSVRQFTYKNEIDTLSYGWTMSHEVFAVMRELLGYVANNKKK